MTGPKQWAYVCPVVTARPILLVEDNEDDVALISRVIETSGIGNPLQFVGTVAEAKLILGAATQDSVPALLLLDISLPDGSGLSLLEWVRSQPPPQRDISAIVVTGARTRSHEAHANRLGAILFLEKPAGPDLLAAAILHFGLRHTAENGSSIEL